MLFSCEKPISEFQSQNFIKFFGSGYESKGNDVIELSDGGYVITGYDKANGSNSQIFAAKVDKNGNLIWSNTFGEMNVQKEGKVVKEVSDGFLIAGTSLGSSGITHSFILKTNAYGDSLWYKEFGDPSYSIVVNDFVVSSSNIFVAGQSDKTAVNKTDFYKAKLDLSGVLIYDKSSYTGTNSSYKRIFLQQGDNLLLIGTLNDNVISIVPVVQSTMNENNPYNTVIANETAADASLNGDQIYLLINNSIQSSFKVSKLNLSYSEEWHTESISSIVGKSVAYNDDGTLTICGESILEGNSIINFIKVNADGSTYYGQQYFRTFQGTVGRVIQTKDKGLIMVGTTNETYGKNVQLIKTDKNYFMLKK